MQWRKRPHARSPSLPSASGPLLTGSSAAAKSVYAENQRRARQQRLRNLLCHTSLAELRDREILRWLEEVDGWLRGSDFVAGELTELRLLVLGVLNTMPWWRILESVVSLQDQRVHENSKQDLGFARNSEVAANQRQPFFSSSFEKRSSIGSGPAMAPAPASASASSVIAGIIRLHERIQLAFEKVCLTLLEGSQRITPNVLEAILKPFSVKPYAQDGTRGAIPADSILRILNQIAARNPASDVLNLFERCLPTLVPKRRWANGHHHVVCTTIFLYLALEGQVPGYNPSCGNSQCLAHMQEFFEEWNMSAAAYESALSSPSPSHASSQNIRIKREVGEEGGCNASTDHKKKFKEELDLIESKDGFALPPSLLSLAAPAAPTLSGAPSGGLDAKQFYKVERPDGRRSGPDTLAEEELSKEPLRKACGAEHPAADGYDTSNSNFSGTSMGLGRETVLKVPARSALADFSDSEGANLSSSSDTTPRERLGRGGAAQHLLSASVRSAALSSGDRAGPPTSASPRDVLLSTAASHAASSTLTAMQVMPQNNRMLAYRSELIDFVLGRLEAMELCLDRAEGVGGDHQHFSNGRGPSLSPYVNDGQCFMRSMPSASSTPSLASGKVVWDAGPQPHPFGAPHRRGKLPSGCESSFPMGSVPSTPGVLPCQEGLKEPRALQSLVKPTPYKSAGGIFGIAAPFSGARPKELVLDSAQPHYEVLKNCCAVVFYMLAKDLCRQQAAGVCGNVDWWRVLVGFQLRILSSTSEIPVCLHYIAPSLAMFGQEEEAVDMIHKVVTLVTKGSFPSSLRGMSSVSVQAEGFGRVQTSMGSATVEAPVRLRMAAPPAMATTQGLSIRHRIRAAMSIAPLFKFMKDRIAKGEGVRKRLLKWVVQEMGRGEAAVAGRRATVSRLVEVVFAQCAAISEMMGVDIVPANPGSGGAEGGHTPLLQPVGGGPGKSTVEWLQPLLDRYALNSDSPGGPTPPHAASSGDEVPCDAKREGSNHDQRPARMKINLDQMERDGLLHLWLMNGCPWEDLLTRMLYSTA